MKKTTPTPRQGHGWEVQLNGGPWIPARSRNRKPRVGGHHVTRYRYFGRITAVRERVSA